MNPSTRPAPQKIIDLVEHFSIQLADYKAGKYNETQLRRDFLDPFFAELGWDMTNEEQAAERYREVINEVSVEVEGKAKAADYAFRIGGSTVFFLEAKKPSVNVGTSADAAFQIRRYAWSAKLPISIVSDFEQLAIYDCRNKPNHSDPVLTGRIELYHYTEFIEKWEDIYALFSKKAVKQGSLDRYATEIKGKRGTADVDDAFLVEMERWREELARNIALRNTGLNTRQINAAVQLTIDRIIFLRICEERGIEAEDALRNATDGVDVYQDLMLLFQQADRKYNSGLFHFNDEKNQSSYPDTLTPYIKIDDKVLKDILANLYYPKCPYAFKYISADILGQVYERFLGKVIRLTAGHQAKVEEKPEVRKAGGVYYTPTYIVEYIVKNTVGELLKDKTPAELEKAPLRVLDPSCGSGSFLLGAYQFLLDWHLEWYEQNDPKKWSRGKNPPIMEIRDGWQLTMEKKKEILTSHIFGVDIDHQAVEVTKLSLLLKVVENPGQLSLLAERILPDLSKNIQCGNSLIGPDYYADQQLTFLDEEEQYRVNAFDWQKSFPFGKFNAVIGNPPYVRQETLGNDKVYFQKAYQVFAGTADLYAYFIEKGISLLAPGGKFSYIVANKWMRANYGKALRAWLKEKCIEEIIDFGDLPVFIHATTYPCIIRVANLKAGDSFYTSKIENLNFTSLSSVVELNKFEIRKETLNDESWSLSDNSVSSIVVKTCQENKNLWDFIEGKVYVGIKTGFNKAFVIDKEIRDRLINEDKRNEEFIKPFLMGKDIFRYQISEKLKYLIFFPKGWTNENLVGNTDAWKWFSTEYSSIAKYLISFKKEAEKRTDHGDYWWELRACAYYSEFQKAKIVFSEIANKGQFSIDEKNSFADMTNYILGTDSKYLLGILNSKLITFIFKNISSEIRGGYLRWKRQYVKNIPIRTIDFDNHKDVARHERMVSLVQSMLDMHKQIQQPLLSQEKEHLQRQISRTDNEIDKLVYELYGLTDEEIKIVEGE